MTESDKPDEQELPGALVDLDERRMWAMLEASPDGMLLANEAGQIVFANAQIEAMFGYSRSELLGQPVEILLPTERREAHIAHRTGYRAKPTIRAMGSGLNLSGQRNDGSEFPVEVSLSPIPGLHELNVVASVRDITDRVAEAKEISDQQATLRMLQYRQRLAEDLHDFVIQQLFASGMGLQSVQGLIDEPTASKRVAETVVQIDETISELRSAIFGLKQPLSDNVVARIGDVLSNTQSALGFRPTLTVQGDPETIGEPLIEQLLPAIREAVSNVARHADATVVQVIVTRTDNGVELRVSDDGVGYQQAETEGRGLLNLAHRAERLDGTMEILANADKGTTLIWTATDSAAETS